MSISSNFHPHVISMKFYEDSMPYFDKVIHVYGWNLRILWYPLKIWTPQNLTIANFRHPVSKFWLSPCHITEMAVIESTSPNVSSSWTPPLEKSLLLRHYCELSHVGHMVQVIQPFLIQQCPTYSTLFVFANNSVIHHLFEDWWLIYKKSLPIFV